MLRILIFIVATAAAVATTDAQNVSPASSGPANELARSLVSAAIPGVIARGTKAEFVRGGFHGTEGVIRAPDGSALFCEQEENRIRRIDLNGNFEIYLENTNRAIGHAYDHKGRLISAQSRDPRIAVLSPTRETLADSFGGQPPGQTQ